MACSVGGGGRLVMVVAMDLSGCGAYKATVLSVDVRTRNENKQTKQRELESLCFLAHQPPPFQTHVPPFGCRQDRCVLT
jgi:hypothetical protein